MTRLAVAAACWIVLTLWGWLELRFSGLVPLSAGLTVGIVYAVATASGARGWSLFRLLFQLYAGVNVLNIQIENLVFATTPPGEMARTTATGLLAAAGVSAALAWASLRDASSKRSHAHRTVARNLWWKLPALGVLYIALFLTAGSLIFPYIREFYARNPLIVMPSFGVLLVTEFTRGVVHALSLLPFLRTMSGRRAHAAVLAGFALAILGGISALLLPIDDVLPPEIRRVHIVEIFGSNFLLGVIAAYLLVRRRAHDVAAGSCQSSRQAPEGNPQPAVLELSSRARP
jgi:hypothetical protein